MLSRIVLAPSSDGLSKKPNINGDQRFQYMGLSENVGYIPNEIAIFHRDNDQQNHWV